jgi:hypothetical protein
MSSRHRSRKDKHAEPEHESGMAAGMERHRAGKHPHQSTEAALKHVAPHPPGRSPRIETSIGSARDGQAPPASSLPGSNGIITNPSAGKPRPMGIPGIITSTSLGPEQRQRMVAGILTMPGSDGHRQPDAVHKMEGTDATAYNSGMIHLRGSPFTMHHR